jgi:hypothetical protein
MGVFDHRHRWLMMAEHAVAREGGGNQAVVRLEECGCGAVRTIEYMPGAAPVVRVIELAQPKQDAKISD